jgi:N utilization substance protein A
MAVELTDEARRYAGRFADVTGVTPRDCLVRAGGERLAVVVPSGEKGTAVGPAGATVERAERLLSVSIDVIEYADTPADFLANALAPAAVRGVTVSRQGVAFAEVLETDRGVAVGEDGHRIDLARELLARHFGVDDVELT